jgi:hypothetical protein
MVYPITADHHSWVQPPGSSFGQRQDRQWTTRAHVANSSRHSRVDQEIHAQGGLHLLEGFEHALKDLRDWIPLRPTVINKSPKTLCPCCLIRDRRGRLLGHEALKVDPGHPGDAAGSEMLLVNPFHAAA